MTVAAFAAFAVYHAFNLPQGYWAVFTTVIVVQSSIGATLNMSIERLIGTVFGAVVGGLGAWLRPETPTGLGVALIVCVAVTAFGAASRNQLRVAPVTAVIMLISPSGGAMGPLETAILRVVEITLGSIIGVAATLLIFPARAHRAAVRRIGAVLEAQAEVIEGAAARLGGETVDLNPAMRRAGAGLTAVEGVMVEAARERLTRLGDDVLPDAVVRTLWRLRSDTVILARTAEAGLPEPAGVRLGPAAQGLLAAEAAFARACAASLATGTVLDRAGLDQTHAAFQAAIEDVRRERLTRDLTLEEISPYFGLVFAAESLAANLADLADRIEEAQGRNDPARPHHRAGAAEASAQAEFADV